METIHDTSRKILSIQDSIGFVFNKQLDLEICWYIFFVVSLINRNLTSGFRDRAASFWVGGAKEECMKEIFFVKLFLFNLFLFLQKWGG